MIPIPRRPLTTAAVAFALACLAAAPAAAGTILSTQHGGRATAQAGAFTARASDPSALFYNPAGIARLDGLQALGGLDFSNATDDYQSATGSFSANHTIQFPPAIYVTYQWSGAPDWAVGLGIDTPSWYSVDFDPALFPGRFLTRIEKRRLWQVHPVVAYSIDDNWSIGAGLRYVFGDAELGQNFQSSLGDGTGNPVPFELELTADESVDAFTWDLGIQYTTNVWGFGATYRDGFVETVDGPYEASVRDITRPELSDQVLALFDDIRVTQGVELPSQVVTGIWIAPYPELRLELDVEMAFWNGQTDIVYRDDAPGGNPFPGRDELQIRRRAWDDTFAVRFGAEGDLAPHWKLSGGLAWEQSPVAGQIEPGFPRGDALVYSVGASYELPSIAFDLGYSFWDYEDRNVGGQELQNPGRRGTYSAREQVWSVSARRRF